MYTPHPLKIADNWHAYASYLPPCQMIAVQLQTYEPYRSSLLNKSTLIALHQLNSSVVVIDTLSAWIVILLSWVTVLYYPYWWVAVAASLVIGTRLYSLLIIAHDGLHRRLFGSIKNNDLWNDLFVLGAIGAITRLNRMNHIRHHRESALPTDPDRFKHSQASRSTRLNFVISLTCAPILIKAIRNVVFPQEISKLEASKQNSQNSSIDQLSRYKMRDILIIVVWQIALSGGLTILIGWWAYLTLWVIPVIFALCCDILRVFCEHSKLENDLDADLSMRLISYDANYLERILFAPNNMNHHIAHHLWPAIPYYNLPKAENLIRSKLNGNQQLVWRPSYFGHIFNYWRWLGCEKNELRF